jgi:hypothetical protein
MSTTKPASETVPGAVITGTPMKSLEELVAEQGVAETATFERLLGCGADWWSDDAEFEAFLEHARSIRREKD